MSQSSLHITFAGSQESSVALEVALARGLRASGHRVSFLAPTSGIAGHLLRRAGEGRGWTGRGSRSPALPAAILDQAMAFTRLRAHVDPDITPGWLDARQALLSRRSRPLRAALEGGDVDRVVVWNGWHPEARAAHLWCRHLGLPCLHLENGLVPGRLQADLAGVNAGASFVGLPPERWPPPGEEVRSWRAAILRGQKGTPGPAVEGVRPALGAAWIDRALARAPRLRRVRRAQPGPPSVPPVGRENPGGEPYVLLALQVPDDTQVLIWSGRELWDPAALVAPVRDAVQRCFGAGVDLAVKPHPLDRTWFRVAAAVERTRGCSLATGDIAPWIDGATAVVVLNSTVGLEGVLRDRPVVTLAASAYAVDGVVQRARGLASLPWALERALSESRSVAATDTLLATLAIHTGIPGGRRRLATGTVPALEALLAAGRHPWTEVRRG